MIDGLPVYGVRMVTEGVGGVGSMMYPVGIVTDGARVDGVEIMRARVGGVYVSSRRWCVDCIHASLIQGRRCSRECVGAWDAP